MLEFWGKTWRENASAPGGVEWKPVLHHLLDVGAAALALQHAAPQRLEREAAALGVEAADLARSRAYLAALHDLGKFSIPFQAKRPDLWPTVLGEPPDDVPDTSHWVLTGRLLRSPDFDRALDAVAPALDRDQRQPLVAAIAGHHGRPPRGADAAGEPPFLLMRKVGRPAVAAAAEAVDALLRLIEPVSLKFLATLEAAQAESWRLSGLVTLADWVGSDATLTAWRAPNADLDAYWAEAQTAAKAAVIEKGMCPAAPAVGGMARLFPHIAEPRPLQRFANDAALPDGPMLAIFEDMTGAGKTEAALTLASRMLSIGKAEGVFFALPTMATADAMFARLLNAHRRLFIEAAQPSIALAHGRRELSEDFRAVRAAAGHDDVAAQCAEWIADDRRKAFFADIGAGTIDQALLAVLPKRFLTLRQYGLAGRVLIIDEAHAFDAYMDEEIAQLLELQAAAGGSAIVLSATLPLAKRKALAAAFRRGVGGPAPTLSCDAYPLATMVSAHGADEAPIAPTPTARPATVVERIGAFDDAVARALDAAGEGASVLWVRNAVDDAAQAAARLRASGATVDLFHARFAMVDRRRIEDAVVARFGKDGDLAGRRGRILVSTQVCESSLDLDFDLLISDLAPVDALIQRAGRMWRHMDVRPAESRPVSDPRLLLLAPDPDAVDSAAWVHEIQEKGGYVYRNPGVLWRTARALVDAGEIRAPNRLRALIESVFTDEDAPEPLRRAQADAEGQDYGEKAHAQTVVINRLQGYGGMAEIHADQEIGTRLGRPTVTLRLARRVDGAVEPWASDPEPRRAWAFSEVVAPAHWLREDDAPLTAPTELQAAVAAARADWPNWDATVVAVVDQDGSVALETSGGDRPLTYAAATGLGRGSPPVRG